MIQLTDMQSNREIQYHSIEELIVDLREQQLDKIADRVDFEKDKIDNNLTSELYFDSNQIEIQWQRGIDYRYYIDFMY